MYNIMAMHSRYYTIKKFINKLNFQTKLCLINVCDKLVNTLIATSIVLLSFQHFNIPTSRQLNSIPSHFQTANEPFLDKS